MHFYFCLEPSPSLVAVLSSWSKCQSKDEVALLLHCWISSCFGFDFTYIELKLVHFKKTLQNKMYMKISEVSSLLEILSYNFLLFCYFSLVHQTLVVFFATYSNILLVV
jgi:hypothetical protein